ncbi:MAG: hypothetical protein M0R17_05415 [Candidatus Omnitrophica bacterium]|jgi:hypothetical protein|nr:hypothetical protein [Candidatus Omnitrophota bacterium]
MYQYDPYTGDQIQPQSNLVGEIASYPIKPSSYFTLATSYPGMYSPTNGVKIPFRKLAKDIKKSIKSPAIYNRYNQRFGKNALKTKFVGLGSRAITSPFSLGMTESEWVGKDWLNKKSVQKYKRVVNKNDFNVALGEAKKDYLRQPNTNKASWTLFNRISEGSRIKNEIGTYVKDGFGFSRKQILAKGALGVAKVGSTIGLGLLAIDLASMVAKPLAQAAIGTLNNLATEYQNRFMPEMGGQLALSYLSQGAYTERQRAIQSISRSSLNARSALGQEANYM